MAPASSRSFQRGQPLSRMRLVFQFFFLLKFPLATKTVLSPRQSIEPPGIDVVAARRTYSVSTLLNSSQGSLGHAYLQLAVASLLEQGFFREGGGTDVADILGTVRIHVAGFISQSFEGPHGFLALGFENAAAP